MFQASGFGLRFGCAFTIVSIGCRRGLRVGVSDVEVGVQRHVVGWWCVVCVLRQGHNPAVVRYRVRGGGDLMWLCGCVAGEPYEGCMDEYPWIDRGGGGGAQFGTPEALTIGTDFRPEVVI